MRAPLHELKAELGAKYYNTVEAFSPEVEKWLP